MMVMKIQLTLLVVHAESSLDLLSDGLHLEDWWYCRSLKLEREYCQSIAQTEWYGEAYVPEV